MALPSRRSVFQRKPIEIVQHLRCGDDVSVFLIYVEEIGLHYRRRAVGYGLTHDDAADVSHEPVGYRGADAAAHARAADEQRVDAQRVEKHLEIGSEERAWPPLADDMV